MPSTLTRRQFALRGSAAIAATAVGLPRIAAAQEFPVKPVKVICPFGAGGLSDVLTRKMAQHLSDRLGQAFVVENRVGASGAIGLNAVASAAPDGYTIGYGSFSTLVLNPLLNPAFPFRPESALMPVAFLGEQAFALAVSPSLGVSTLPELVAKLKANPGKYNFGSPGTGLTQHILGELFKRNAGVDITHVPYQSDAQAFQAVVGEQVQMAFTNFALYRQLLDRVRIVALAAPERSAQLPNVSTFTEHGINGVDITVWHGFFSAAGVPRNAIDRIDREVQAGAGSQEMRTYYEQNGLVARPMPQQDFQRRFHDQIAAWKKIVPDLKLKLS